LSKDTKVKNEKVSEERASEKEKKTQLTPSERDHYVYESIIAEIGY